MKPLTFAFKVLFIFYSGLCFGQGGGGTLLKAQVDAHIKQGMKGHRIKDDILWIKTAAQNFKELIDLLEVQKGRTEYVNTDMFGEKSPEDLIIFAKDRLLELGALKLNVCKGQPITIRAKIFEGQERTLVGTTQSLPCGKLKDVESWQNSKAQALKYCEQGEIKMIASAKKGYGPQRAGASTEVDSSSIKLFCFEETEVRIKNEFPELFRY